MVPPIKAGFVLNNILGHKSHAMNLEEFAPNDKSVDCVFSIVPSGKNDWKRTPIVKHDANLQAGLEGRAELTRLVGKVDIAFMHTDTTAFFSADLMRHIPTIVSLDATQHQWYEMNKSSFSEDEEISLAHRLKMAILQKTRLKHRMYKKVFRRAVHVVTWSEWAKKGVCDEYGLEASKVSVIPPGVEMSRFKPVNNKSDASGQPVRILFVGGDFYRKGGGLVLRWARETRTKIPWELHIVTREVVTDVPANVRVYNDVQNNSTQLIELFEQSDIFVLPTLADTFGIVLLEAMASGLPVVASRIAAIPEIVSEGETGYLFEPENYEEFDHAVARLIENPDIRQQMGDTARTVAMNRWNFEATYGALLGLVREVALQNIPK